MRRFYLLAITLLISSLTAPVLAQSSTSGAAIDVEIYNIADGSNVFRVEQGSTFWAYVYVRPVNESIYPQSQTLCSSPHCSGTVYGGQANLATGVIDIGFDPSKLTYLSAETNPDVSFAAADGLIQEQKLADGRIGWALAGDWSPDADPTGALANPCDMTKLDRDGWVFRVQFRLDGGVMTRLHIRRATDSPPFRLSFADACDPPHSYTVSNGGIEEVIDATVLYPGALFADGFGSADTTAWSAVVW